MAETQRLDKWLWFARVVKTRSRAAELVSSGHVRVNARRIDAPAKTVTQGDVLTIALEREVRVLRVLDPGKRRGAYPEARLLFEDLSGDAAARDLAAPKLDYGAQKR
jgi:ribosome-associated heat shock protein Hsp15